MRNSGAAIFFLLFRIFEFWLFRALDFLAAAQHPCTPPAPDSNPELWRLSSETGEILRAPNSAEPPSGISAAPPGKSRRPVYVSNFSAPPEHAPAPATKHLLRAPRHYSPSDPISRYSGALAKPTTAIASATLGDANSAVFGPHSPTTTPSMRERSLRECIF